MKVKEIRRKLSKYRTHYFRSKTAAVNTSPRQSSDFTHCATSDEDLGRKKKSLLSLSGMWIFGDLKPSPCLQKWIFAVSARRSPYSKYEKKRFLRVILLYLAIRKTHHASVHIVLIQLKNSPNIFRDQSS